MNEGRRVGDRRGRGKGRGSVREVGRSLRGSLVALSLLAGALGGAVRPADAQEVREAATPFLPPDHWGYGAARRLEGVGLTAASNGWSEGALRRGDLLRLFRAAVALADSSASAHAPLAHAYLARLEEEFGVGPTAPNVIAPYGFRVLEASVAAGYDRERGRVLAGIGYNNANDWTGPLAAPDESDPSARLTLAAALTRYMAVTVTPVWHSGGWSLANGHFTASHGKGGVWFGRRVLGFGPGDGGSVVLTPGVAFDGGGFFLAGSRLPGVLGVLGPVHFDLFLSRAENRDRIRNPWFTGMRASVAPHPRLALGLNRGILFGGQGNSSVSLRNLAYMLVGKHSGEVGEFDDQVVSLDVRYRPPLGSLPVVVYLEWGADDSAGAWKDVPGHVVGLELAALPGLPSTALWLERTSFAAACCGNTIWYRNWAFRGGWSADGEPLAHPLGGHGTEWLLGARGDLLDARLHLEGRAFARWRGEENLFAPDRVGDSYGGVVRLEGRLSPRVDLLLRTALERGEQGWRESGASVALKVRHR